MSIFYIADIHEGHANALAFDNRPFLTIDAQREQLIKNWNDVVKQDDITYILGDESWYTPNSEEYQSFFESLNGNKVLLLGNHSAKIGSFTTAIRKRCKFTQITDYLQADDNGRQVVLSHYPILAFNRSYYGAYHLYGHVHASYEWNMMETHRRQVEELYSKPFNAYNVGVMMPYMHYAPQTLDEVIAGYAETMGIAQDKD